MFVLGNFITAFAQLVDSALHIYFWILLFRVASSWVQADPYNPIVRFLYSATEPVLRPIRRAMPFSLSGIDVSPIVLMLLLEFFRSFLVRTLYQLATSV